MVLFYHEKCLIWHVHSWCDQVVIDVRQKKKEVVIGDYKLMKGGWFVTCG